MRYLAIILLSGLGCTAAAGTTTYNYTFTAVTPTSQPPYRPALNPGWVQEPAGKLLGSGTFTVGDTVRVVTSPDPTCTINCAFEQRTITSMAGSFLGEPISFYANPIAPEMFQIGKFYGDWQFLTGADRLLDAGGVILNTPALGDFNLLGIQGLSIADNPPYEIITSNLIFDPFRGRSFSQIYYGDFAVTLAQQTTLPGGTQANPTILPQLAISSISAAIGPESPQQFYSFYWGGGTTPFTTNASVTDAGTDYSSDFSSLVRARLHKALRSTPGIIFPLGCPSPICRPANTRSA